MEKSDSEMRDWIKTLKAQRASLLRKADLLQTAIVSLESAAQGVEGGEGQALGVPAIRSSQLTSSQPDVRGMTPTEAARHLLSYLGHLPTRELWDRMAAGGVATTSTNPLNNLNSILSRNPEFLKDDQGRWFFKPTSRQSDLLS